MTQQTLSYLSTNGRNLLFVVLVKRMKATFRALSHADFTMREFSLSIEINQKRFCSILTLRLVVHGVFKKTVNRAAVIFFIDEHRTSASVEKISPLVETPG
jgi:hypothetical protein